MKSTLLCCACWKWKRNTAVIFWNLKWKKKCVPEITYICNQQIGLISAASSNKQTYLLTVDNFGFSQRCLAHWTLNWLCYGIWWTSVNSNSKLFFVLDESEQTKKTELAYHDTSSEQKRHNSSRTHPPCERLRKEHINDTLKPNSCYCQKVRDAQQQ